MRVSRAWELAGSGVKLIQASFAEIPITSSDFWQDENECTDEVLKHVFRSSTQEEIPLFQERMACLREAGNVLYEVGHSSLLFIMLLVADGYAEVPVQLYQMH